jgi:hypothetical protein
VQQWSIKIMARLAESLGIRTVTGVEPLIEEGTDLPMSLIRKFATAGDHQRAATKRQDVSR